MKACWLALLALGFIASCSRGSSAPNEDERYDEARKAMVERQLQGEGRGIKNERVLKAMGEVKRHAFVPESQRAFAYEDRPLPIGHRQTISQPYIVAFMTEKLDPQPGDKVLEIGTGSGYQAAVLAKLVKQVYTIEIVKPLAERAKGTLGALGYENVQVMAGDGYKGWPAHAPFDAVIVTCAPDHIPKPLVEQLKEGGKMIIPVGEEGGLQQLFMLRKKEGQVVREAVLPVRFVPMTGER